jgi:hypothetical protein
MIDGNEERSPDFQLPRRSGQEKEEIKVSMIRVEDGCSTVGYVEYSTNLDHWDGSRWGYGGGVGEHRGLVRWHDGYVVVYGSEYPGHTYGVPVGEVEAKTAVFASGDPDLAAEFFPGGVSQEEISSDVDVLYRWGLI